MAILQAADVADVVIGTLRNLGRMKFQQIAQNLQQYEVMAQWFRKDKMTFQSGRGINRQLMNKLSNQARHRGLLDTDAGDIPDLLDQITVDWRHADTKWVIVYQTDILMNSGEELVTNVIQPKRADAMISLAEELEEKAFAIASSSNKTDPWGLPYWIVTNSSTGFNGGAPSGHTTVGGVDLSDSPTFKNYTAQYTNVSKSDLIKKMRSGHRKVRWKSPVNIDDYRQMAGPDFRIYCKEATLSSFEDIGEAQNENLGRDLAPMGGVRDVRYVNDTIVFRKIPIINAWQLDDSAFTAANNPVYMVDHTTFYPVCLKGDFLRESPPEKAPGQHNVWRVFVDLTYNYICIDRRRNAVFDTAA